MQLVLDRWNTRASTAVPPELIGRIAPTRTEGINLRGVFSFPIEQYVEQLLRSLAATKSRIAGALTDPKCPMKNALYAAQNGPIESMRCDANVEISRKKGGLSTGTFGTEIKGRPRSHHSHIGRATRW
jgi:hypothetical protein